MAGFLSAKTKRKDLEVVNDEFSEFSLSSPARKIRRLDAELPPIIEEEEPAVPLIFNQQLPNQQANVSTPPPVDADMGTVPLVPWNDERALVLYKPVNSPFIMSPSSPGVSLQVTPDLMPGLKSQAMWSGTQNTVMVDGSIRNSWAVVPWVPSQSPATTQVVGDIGLRDGMVEEPMEAEEAGSSSMEVEEVGGQATTSEVGGEGFHQWPLQHCMTPQLQTSRPTPIMWS